MIQRIYVKPAPDHFPDLLCWKPRPGFRPSLLVEMDEAMIERAAEASYLHDCDGQHDIGWDAAPEDVRHDYIEHAWAVLGAALEVPSHG